MEEYSYPLLKRQRLTCRKKKKKSFEKQICYQTLILFAYCYRAGQSAVLNNKHFLAMGSTETVLFYLCKWRSDAVSKRYNTLAIISCLFGEHGASAQVIRVVGEIIHCFYKKAVKLINLYAFILYVYFKLYVYSLAVFVNLWENDGLALCCTLVLKICHCKTRIITIPPPLIQCSFIHKLSINVYIHIACYSKV